MTKDTTIKSIDGTGGVTVAEGYSFFIGVGFEQLPKVGDKIRTINVGGKEGGLGTRFRGMVLNGVTLWEKSEEQIKVEDAAWLADYERKNREEEDRGRAEYATRLESDPLAFDWDREGSSVNAAAALDRVKDESEFPATYAGQAWRYAYRLWKLTQANASLLDTVKAFDSIPGAEDLELDMTGFMIGWARSAVRQMLISQSMT